jgi:hypothetical protein
MTFHALHRLQDVMFRLYVRSVMILATLPYHVAERVDGNRTRGDLARMDRPR